MACTRGHGHGYGTHEHGPGHRGVRAGAPPADGFLASRYGDVARRTAGDAYDPCPTPSQRSRQPSLHGSGYCVRFGTTAALDGCAPHSKPEGAVDPHSHRRNASEAGGALGTRPGPGKSRICRSTRRHAPHAQLRCARAYAVPLPRSIRRDALGHPSQPASGVRTAINRQWGHEPVAIASRVGRRGVWRGRLQWQRASSARFVRSSPSPIGASPWLHLLRVLRSGAAAGWCLPAAMRAGAARWTAGHSWPAGCQQGHRVRRAARCRRHRFALVCPREFCE